MKLRDYKEFPINIKQLAWSIYPVKKQVVVNGFKYFSLVELKKIELNTRLSFPAKLFAAIDNS